MKIFKKFIYIIVLVCFIFIAGGLIITFLYQDEVTEFLIKEINKNLKTEIVVDKVNFSVLKRFPNASLEFKNLVTKSAPDYNNKDFKELNNDTLFTARSLILKFNIIDIFRKNYKIKTIHSKKGVLRIFKDKKGENNYSIWNEKNENTDANFNINLENITISDYNCLYIDLSRKVTLNTDINHLRINGDILSKQSDIITNSILNINELIFDDIKYLDSKALFFHADINKNSDFYVLNDSRLSIDKMKFNLNGEYSANSKNLVINIKGKNISIPSFLTIFPLKVQNEFVNYTLDGTGSFDLNISGTANTTENLNLDASYDLVNAEIIKNNSNYYLTDIFCKGTYSNGINNNPSDSRIELSEYSFSYEKGTISGNLNMQDFPNPAFSIRAKSNFYAKDLQKLIDIKPFDDLGGIISTDLQIEGNIKNSSNISARKLKISKIKGNMIIQDGSAVFFNEQPDLSGINAWIKFNNTIFCDSVYFKTGDNDCFFRGELKNVINHLSDNTEVIYITGFLVSDYFIADKYFIRDSIADPEEKNIAIFPDNINLNLYFSADSFSYKNFEARKVESRFNYRPKMLVINSFSLSAFEGEISGGGAIIQKYNKEFLLKSHTKLSNIDINRLFYSFNNFGQDYIIYENLKGVLNGYLNLSSECYSDLSVKDEKIVVESSFEIYNGELINFEPMNNLSRFIEVSELGHIKFSTLKNEIFIRDKQIIIPQMDINSSAISFSGSGKHNFNNDFSYKTKVLLSEVLSSKAKKAKKENEEFGIIEDDGLGKISLYLTFTGNPDDYKISYDNQAVKEVIKNNIAEERNELKTILNEEFGWFQKENKSISDTSFTFEWEEPDIITTNQNQGKADTNSVNFIIEWDEDEKILPDTIKRKKKKGDK